MESGSDHLRGFMSLIWLVNSSLSDTYMIRRCEVAKVNIYSLRERELGVDDTLRPCFSLLARRFLVDVDAPQAPSVGSSNISVERPCITPLRTVRTLRYDLLYTQLILTGSHTSRGSSILLVQMMGRFRKTALYIAHPSNYMHWL